MTAPKLTGGPTQDEILAVSLSKLGLCSTDSVLEIGCGTGKVTVAMAKIAREVHAIDRRQEAVECAGETVRSAGRHNIRIECTTAEECLSTGKTYDCAFVGGTHGIARFLPELVRHVRRTIVINAVLLDTLYDATAALKGAGAFREVIQVQVSRSHELAESIMLKPIDPVYIIKGEGTAC
jgi:cobalt-precorrin-6B (C15)-methyltransferase